jgi:hypothetical protein
MEAHECILCIVAVYMALYQQYETHLDFHVKSPIGLFDLTKFGISK